MILSGFTSKLNVTCFFLYLLQEILKFKEGEEKMKKDLAESEKKITPIQNGASQGAK